MEAEGSKLLVNGGDAVQNGFPDETPPTPEEKEEEDQGEAIKALRVEIESLKKERSELLAEMDRSEAEKKGVAAHASFLEGEISRLQHDILTAESSAFDADAEIQRFRQALDKLDAEKSMLEARIVEQGTEMDRLHKREEEVFALKKEVEALENELQVTKEKAGEEMEGEAKKKVELVKVVNEKAWEVEALENELRVTKERAREEMEVEVKKNVELEKVVKELEERLSAPQIKVEDRELEINGHVEAQQGFKLPFAAQMAALASAGAVTGVVAAAIYLRCARQR